MAATLHYLIRSSGLTIQMVGHLLAEALGDEPSSYQFKQIEGETPFQRRENIRRVINSGGFFVACDTVYFQGAETIMGLAGRYFVYYNWLPPIIGENQPVDEKADIWDVRRIYPPQTTFKPFPAAPASIPR